MGAVNSYANGLNAAGQVVGSFDGNMLGPNYVASAFVYSAGVGTVLPTLGGVSAEAFGINDSGVVVGRSRIDATQTRHAWMYAGGMLTDLGVLGNATSSSTAYAINALGVIAGGSTSTTPRNYNPNLNAEHSFSSLAGGSLLDLTPASGVMNHASAINASGRVAGSMTVLVPIGGGSSLATTHPMIIAGGSLVDLGTLSGPTGFAQGINASGVVVGGSSIGLDASGNELDSHAFAYSGGALNDLGSPLGGESLAMAINDAGLIVGYSSSAVATHAVVWSAGTGYDLNTLAPAGWSLNSATAINASGLIAGNGTHGGHAEAFTLRLNPSWQGGSGQWDNAGRWAMGGLFAAGQSPGVLQDAVVRPTGTATVQGGANAAVNRLTIGGYAGQIVSFDLNGGTTATVAGTTLGANAVLTGSGLLVGALVVQPGGVLQINGSQSMQLSGGPVTIQGTARVYGGGGSAVLSATDSFTVAAGGQLNLQSANLDLRGGLVVYGQLNASYGGINVSGPVTVATGARMVLSGNAGTAFYDAVEVQNLAEFRVSAGATATFFGPAVQRTGALFTGTGGKYFEGGLSIGSSPGLGVDAGSVTFGAGNTFLAEIGGVAPCTADCLSNSALRDSSFDKYVVAGHLTLGGTLKLTSWNGFTGQTGQSFDLFDWGSASGIFAAIDASGLHLAPGTVLDTSQLYSNGTIAIQAVPEPGAAWLFATGLGALGFMVRRRGRVG